MAKDYYKILEISKGTSLKDMEKSYKRLANKWHPDKWRTALDTDRLYAEEMMKDINEAHDELKKILPILPRVKTVIFSSTQSSSEDKPKSKYAHEDNIWDVDLGILSNNYFGSTSKTENNSDKVKDSLWADSEKLKNDLFGI